MFRRPLIHLIASILLALTCLCVLLVFLSPRLIAADSCAMLFNSAGWIIETCPTDPNVTTPMTVTLNGVSPITAALVRVYHKAEAYVGTPQVTIFYASGYIRLKPNADPTPAIPFGSSFVLGPAYWAGGVYYNSPQLTRLDIDPTWLPNAPLRMSALGVNGDFVIAYDMALPPPHDRQTRLHVVQTYTATKAISIDPMRRAQAEGFKLVQFSSMFINQGGSCDGGKTDCHDSNAVRYIGSDLVRHQVPFTSLTPSTFIFTTTTPLGSTWLDLLHTDDTGWQGNTPNIRIALDVLPLTTTVTPQGYIAATTNPNNDNVGLWLHDDGSASLSWTTGQTDTVSYWLMAQDNPPDPIGDLGLRPGMTFLDFENGYNCKFVYDEAKPYVTGTIGLIGGASNKALQMSYTLATTPGITTGQGNWVQIRCDFDPPLNLSAYDYLRFEWRGDPNSANSMQVALISGQGTAARIFARGFNHATQRGWWGQMVMPLVFLDPWTPNTTLDTSQISAFFVSITREDNDSGGTGQFAIDNIGAFNAISRLVPPSLTLPMTNVIASQAAVTWLVAQQTPSGLVKSWAEEIPCNAYTYDQALALLVFSRERRWAEADKVVGALAATQVITGAWRQGNDCSTSVPVVRADTPFWEGDIAWAVYALSRYLGQGGTRVEARAIMTKGAQYLTTLIANDGCLKRDHTEATIDVWWTLRSVGQDYRAQADGLQQCLLNYYWNDSMGRFKGGRNWWQPYLDNQTWGAAFLKAIGETEKARRALSYARLVLPTVAQGGQAWGFDGQGGPWSLWNEGGGQYAAVGAMDADELLGELLAQQQRDGAMPSSTDDFNGAGVWTTRWHGVAPTAWLYFALNREPFYAPHAWLPILMK